MDAVVTEEEMVDFEIGELVAEETTVEDATPAANKLITLVYAGFVEKSEFQRHASPCPENVLGIQEYLSV